MCAEQTCAYKEKLRDLSSSAKADIFVMQKEMQLELCCTEWYNKNGLCTACPYAYMLLDESSCTLQLKRCGSRYRIREGRRSRNETGVRVFESVARDRYRRVQGRREVSQESNIRE